jgi:hypothetical protein
MYMQESEVNVIDVANTRDLRTTDVLADLFANYTSREMEEHYAVQWEEENCKALVRSWEEHEDGKFAATYHQRRTSYEAKAKKAKRPQLAFSCAPEIAKEELEKFNRIPLSEIARNKELQEQMDGYRAVLGLPAIDYTKIEQKTAPGADYETKAAEFLKLPRNERAQALATLSDRTLLGYIVADDPDGEIRAIAQGRLLNLAVAA